MTKDLATRAMKVAKQIKDDYELSDEEVGKMARLSLFDIFILCGRLIQTHAPLSRKQKSGIVLMVWYR